ncbi:MATE family efflux transporter [bacterium]|nr:MATE family efflux transporter [bacterium]
MNFKIYINYLREVLTLSFPMMMGNLGAMLIGAGSVLVAAKYSTDTLAAISIANSVISCIVIFGIGMLAAVSPVLANRRGEKKSIKKYFVPTVEFSLVLAFFAMIVILLSIPCLEHVGFDPKIMPMIKQFMFISAFSTFGVFLQIALKEYLQAFEIVMFPNMLAFVSVFLNLILNFALVFGWGGLPALGVKGLAIADLIMRYFMGITMLVYCMVFINIHNYHENKYFVSLLKIGLPISFAILLEFLAFNLGTIIMGHVAGVYAACQNILVTITSITFMIPMAISNALSVKVGFANGAKNFTDLIRYSIVGIFASLLFMGFCSILLWSMPNLCIKIFSSDTSVLKICVPILIVIGFYQIFDGLQVSLGGIFKGLKKTKSIMVADLVAYWVVGLPIGFILAFKYHMNLYGLWVGLAISIFTLSLFLLIFLFRALKKINPNINN